MPDCRLPSFTVTTSQAARLAPEQGAHHAEIASHDGVEASGIDPASITGTLDFEEIAAPVTPAQLVVDPAGGVAKVSLAGLADGKLKHVEEVATRNLAAEVREAFEPAGTRYFLMGETAMGWSDCPDPCNDESYGTISRYIGPLGLDGQLDFVLYHGVSTLTFAHGDKGMLHADYWFTHGLSKYPSEAIMTPYIGSHDTPRFATLADCRGQDPAHDRGIPNNQWDTIAGAPGDAEPYKRARIGLAWLLNLPGAPLLYYGDEYGQ